VDWTTFTLRRRRWRYVSIFLGLCWEWSAAIILFPSHCNLTFRLISLSSFLLSSHCNLWFCLIFCYLLLPGSHHSCESGWWGEDAAQWRGSGQQWIEQQSHQVGGMWAIVGVTLSYGWRHSILFIVISHTIIIVPPLLSLSLGSNLSHWHWSCG
jgi:hypothetical protein